MSGALLFDLDGTLVDTDPLHAAVFIELFAERGLPLDFDTYTRTMHGRLNQQIFGERFPDEDPDALSDMKEARFREKLGGEATPVHGLVALLDWAQGLKLPVAIVTNAPRDNAEAMLDAIGLRNRFGLVVVGSECHAGKPDPEPYKSAMRQLGVAPACSVAFEDSVAGVTAAHASGAYCIGLTSTLDHPALITAGAHSTISNFTELHLPTLYERLKGTPA